MPHTTAASQIPDALIIAGGGVLATLSSFASDLSGHDLGWLETFGGWGAVLIVLHWLMRRSDAAATERAEETKRFMETIEGSLNVHRENGETWRQSAAEIRASQAAQLRELESLARSTGTLAATADRLMAKVDALNGD